MRKSFDIRPVDMCIYIDNHIYEPDFDPEKIFNYLYNLFYTLSIKKRFFNNEKDYDNYSLYAATEVYLRLTNKKQFLPEGDPRKLKKIKSILNYIKHTMYPIKVTYQSKEYSNIFKSDHHDEDLTDLFNANVIDSVLESSNSLLAVDMELYLRDISKTV